MTRNACLLVVAISVFLLTLGLQIWSAPENPGVISFELAFDRLEAQLILEAWNEEGQSRAKRNIWLDFLFIPGYVGLLLALFRFGMKKGDQWMLRYARLFCTLPVVAGCLDVAENILLLSILGNPKGFTSWAIVVASSSAALKFCLLALSGGILIAWVWRSIYPWFWPVASDLGSVLWLCRASVLGLAAGAAFLLFVPQGRDVVIGLADVRRSTRLGFFLAVSFWAVHIWYWARLMVRIMWEVSSRSDKADLIRKHLPRILGTAAFGIVALAFFKAWWEASDETSVYLSLVVRNLILAALFYGFTVARRPMMIEAHRNLSKIKSLERGVMRKAIDVLKIEPSDQLSSYKDSIPIQGSFIGSITPLAVFLMVSALTFFCSFSFSGELARRFGSAAVLLLAGGVWMPVGALLIYIATRFKVPVIAMLLAAAVLFSFFNDNHVVRTLGPRSIHLPEGVSGVESHFRQWLVKRNITESSEGLYPVVVVAAEGGGIRAAYWTAAVLGRLQDLDPGFADHVYAISGVSGGSLGGAVFTALVAEGREHPRLPCAGKKDTRGPFESCADTMLSTDFLAPTIGSLLYADLLQRFLPFPVPGFDRGRGLERSWERAWIHLPGIDSRRFGTRGTSPTFDDLWCNRSEKCSELYHVPLLFLNTTHVEAGRRVIISPIEITSSEFTDAEGFFENCNRKISLSSAVHNSARFTFVSPAGTVKRENGEVWGHVVDGGYFENSGATTALEILRAMEAGAGALWPKLKPIVLMISNDPKLGERPEPRTFLKEVSSPIVALLNTRGARGSYSREALKDFFPEACRRERFQEIDLVGIDGVPLGWVLSESATEIMREQAVVHVDRVRKVIRSQSGCAQGAEETEEK